MHWIDKRKKFDLGDIVFGWKAISFLLLQAKFVYYKNLYVLTSSEVYYKKNKLYQFSWLQNSHVYRRELKDGLFTVCIFFW